MKADALNIPLRCIALVAIVLCGCQSYGSGPRPKTHEQMVAACGTLPPGWRQQTEQVLHAKAQSSLTVPEAKTANITVGEPYRARSYRGLMSYGHFAWGWAIPMSIQWSGPDGKPRVWSDTLLYNTNAESALASRIPGIFIDKFE